MEVPVYLLTGFIESGKTSFLQDTLADPNFFDKGSERTLVLLCEEGEVELDSSSFASENVYIEIIDSERRVNPDKFESLRAKHNADRVMIEYNGMWLVSDLYNALPENWMVYQEIFFCNASSVDVFNMNMRNLVVDKITGADLVVFNRCDESTEIEALHKIVRGVSRRPNIIYEKTDGSMAYDDIEDPLPYDINKAEIEIGDSDYALFYRDLSENMKAYNGKTISFLGQVSKDNSLPKKGFIIGRPIMTCCVEDIQFSGLFSENEADKVNEGQWVRIKAEVDIKYCEVYGREGPVLTVVSLKPDKIPDNPVSTFY